VATGFSPLDEELGLVPGAFSPGLQEDLVHLGTWMPFAHAATEVSRFRRVAVAEPTARRLTEAAGAAWVAIQTAELERLHRDLPTSPAGPAVQPVSVDGAMLPLVGGEWAAARLLAVGTVETTPSATGPPAVRTAEWSYFARLADAETFTRLAGVELHRRGTETAGVVAAPVDGAGWCQTFLDVHRPDAVRILDFPHALEHLAPAAQACFGPGTPAASEWLGQQAHTLRHEDPEAVLRALRDLPVQQAADPRAATAVRDATLGYLEKRRAQIQYAAFAAAGYPLGSGGVESGNKLVMEARLKGAGMHWARAHVDPLLAVRTIACADRWQEAWPELAQHLRTASRQRRHARRTTPTEPPSSRGATTASPTPLPAPRLLRPEDLEPTRPKTIVHGRPTADHPWKKHPALASSRPVKR
jgi:hypothetical protein